MKTLTIFFVFIIFLATGLLAQQITSPHLLNHNLLNQQVPISITHNTQVSTVEHTTINQFKLKPGEMKAVAKIGTKPKNIQMSYLADSTVSTSAPKFFILPEVYFAREEATNRQISYQIYFVDTAPLKIDFNQNVFHGGIRFIPYQRDIPAGSQVTEKRLAVPDTIYVSYKDVDIPLVIHQINFPPIDVPITYPNPLDSLGLKILTAETPLGYTAYIPVEPAIVLSCTRRTILGYGLQEIPIAVNLRGISNYRPISLSVMSSLGTIDSSKVTLTDDSPGEVRLRSEGSGMIKVNVAGANYLSNSLSIEAVVPWLFLILAILGGLLGGIGKRYFGNGKIDTKLIILSCIIGLIVAAAYWGLGINLINFTFEDRGYNEAMVLAIALLAGYFGIKNPVQSAGNDG